MFSHKFRTCQVLLSLGLTLSFSLSSCSARELPSPEPAPQARPEARPESRPEAPPPTYTKSKIHQFEFVYEPSGILRLPNGEMLVIEDEPSRAFSTLSYARDGIVQRTPIAKPKKQNPGRLEDLEGLASDGQGHYFAITSHSKTPKGRLPHTRKKLVRFTLDGYAMNDVFTVPNVKKKILKEYKTIRSAVSRRRTDINIEALSYHRSNQSLMLGLRTPLVKDEAIIAVISNPDQIFTKKDKIKFADKLITLNLDKGGIRAIAYDESLGGYLILSRREDKKDTSFKLWLWDGKAKSTPRRIRFDADFGLDFAEGVSPILTKNMAGLLIVFDDGDARKSKGAHYALLPYNDLSIDDQ